MLIYGALVQVALGVALAAAGVSYAEALQPNSQQAAAEQHSRAVANDLTLAKVAERCVRSVFVCVCACVCVCECACACVCV